MVWGRVRDALSGVPKLEGEAKLPSYFPVEPKGCERHGEKLFVCLATNATEKARDMEKAGLHTSFYDKNDTKKDKTSESTVKKDATTKNTDASGSTLASLPKANDNPLDECRTLIAYYKRCCDRELKKRRNWILTEPFRVQEEYRYNEKQQQQEAASTTKK